MLSTISSMNAEMVPTDITGSLLVDRRRLDQLILTWR